MTYPGTGTICKIDKICKHCGVVYHVPTSVQVRNQKFCSQTCMATACRGKRKHPDIAEAKKCARCGIDFIATTPKANCCSAKCGSVMRARGTIAKNSDLKSHIDRLLKMSGYDRSGLSLTFIMQMYEAQGGCCALTGIQMTWKTNAGRVQTNLSIDRISVLCGYTQDNVQLVCRMANIMKGELSQSDFVAVCRRVVEKASAR